MSFCDVWYNIVMETRDIPAELDALHHVENWNNADGESVRLAKIVWERVEGLCKVLPEVLATPKRGVQMLWHLEKGEPPACVYDVYPAMSGSGGCFGYHESFRIYGEARGRTVQDLVDALFGFGAFE